MTGRPEGGKIGARHMLSAILAAQGYLDHDVPGPLVGREGAEYTVTIHARRGEPARTLRGTFPELRPALEALPRREL